MNNIFLAFLESELLSSIKKKTFVTKHRHKDALIKRGAFNCNIDISFGVTDT